MQQYRVALALRQALPAVRPPLTAPLDQKMALDPPAVPPSPAVTQPPQGDRGNAPVSPQHPVARTPRQPLDRLLA